MPYGSLPDSAPERSLPQQPDSETELAAAYLALEASRAREASLRNELEHGVRNAAAITRSVFLRTMDNAATLEDARNHFVGRLDALARYNTRLAFGSAANFDLETMIWDELISMAVGSDARIEVTGPEVRLSQSVASVIGLALHELGTNSIKFGVLGSSSTTARLSVHWTETEQFVRLEWSESGIPIVVSRPIDSGFGRSFIENALPYQLNAQTHFQLVPGGLICQIQFPQDGLPPDEPFGELSR